MRFGIAKDTDEGRRWWTPSGWGVAGVAFNNILRAQKQAERLRERGNLCIAEECSDEWPLYDGRLLHRARRRDSTMVNTTAQETVPCPPGVVQYDDATLARVVDRHWEAGRKRTHVVDARLVGLTDPGEARQLLLEHIRLGRAKCLLRPQLWAAYAELHAEARVNLLPRYLPYELHDDHPVESAMKDLREGEALPVQPEPSDRWEMNHERRLAENEMAARITGGVKSIFRALFGG